MATQSTPSDQELVDLLKSGNHAAFTELYKRYWTVLFHHARKMLQDEDAAVDIVQDVFTTIWIKSAEININISIKAYLYAAVRNRIVSSIRHSKVHESYLDSLVTIIEKGEMVTDEQVRYREFSAQIEMEISKLPPKMREVFELSRKEGLSHSQIAQELNIADETVKKQIYKAMKTLRLKLDAFLFTLLL
ncbi:RNA polymerase sigma factor [Mucilaginibacter sp. UYCu711]|uniref:RNA polymerase sigma factor n=1 Tax=Mucilaginibacter sp. UYCu711 TaxID=3156339 RepID=UPI003D24D9B4